MMQVFKQAKCVVLRLGLIFYDELLECLQTCKMQALITEN